MRPGLTAQAALASVLCPAYAEAMSILPPYAPDDARLSIAALDYLLTPAGAALRQAALATDGGEVSAVAALRKTHPADAVHAALTLAALQPKAQKKFPGGWFWSPPEALEQSSSLRVAQHKAQRLAVWPDLRAVVDLCAGVGGDALGLADVAPVTAVEMSPIRAWCAAQNALARPMRHPISIVCADVRQAPVAPGPGVAFHIDPARRSAGTRSAAYEDLIPGPPVLEQLLSAYAAGAIKLSSAVAFESLPPGHLELISEERTATQAVLWTGALAELHGGTATRSATVLSEHAAAFTLTAAPGASPSAAAPQAFVYEVDPALHRAGLAGTLAAQLQAAALSADGGYITSAQTWAHAAVVGFSHVTTFDYSEKRVAAALRTLAAGLAEPGPVEVKTRGGLALDTDGLQRTWSRLTPQAVTVLVYRGAGGVQATIALRHPLDPPSLNSTPPSLNSRPPS